MKKILYPLIALTFFGHVLQTLGQKTIYMQKENGVFVVPCSVNGLKLKFIFDTGASDVSISLTEALFMLKNDYLEESDIIGTTYSQIANGEITENTRITLKEIEFAGLILQNINASVVHELAAPLLLGQSAMSQLGTFQLDPNSGALTIFNSLNDDVYTYSEPVITPNIYGATCVITRFYTKLMKTPKDVLEKETDEVWVPYSHEVKLLGVENGFYKVEYNNSIGYLNSFVAEVCK